MVIIKTISLILILGLATYVGNIMAKKYTNRVKELICIKLALNFLENKIKFTQTPLKEIFNQIAKTTNDKNIKNLFSKIIENLNKNLSITLALENAINTCETNLTKEDRNILLDMGKMLGKTDVEGQVSQIEITNSFLNNQIEKAEKEKNKNTKLYKTLGIISGLAIIIILI